MAVSRRIVKGIYNGECVVLRERLNLPPDTEVDVVVPEETPTWAEKVLGLPRLLLRGAGPTTSEMIIEDRN
jgi:hypothetical protein